ncbi:MAG: hypothetical protein WB785_18565 [Mycobacterium sp.]
MPNEKPVHRDPLQGPSPGDRPHSRDVEEREAREDTAESQDRGHGAIPGRGARAPAEHANQSDANGTEYDPVRADPMDGHLNGIHRLLMEHTGEQHPDAVSDPASQDDETGAPAK